MNYQSAKELIKNRESKKLANNTYLMWSGENLTVELHNSPILTFYPNGDTMIDLCGWNTMTTRDRINEFLPQEFKVSTDKGILYLCRDRIVGGYRTFESFVFKDGITIGSRGGVRGAGSRSSVKEMQKLRKSALQYCKDYIKKLCSNKVPAPSEGDCWDCSFIDEDEKTMGELSKSSHIHHHIKQKYYVPSLFANAIKQFPLSPIVNDTLSALWCGDDYPSDREEFVYSVRNNIPHNKSDKDHWGIRMLKQQGLSSLKRYIYQQLNLSR